MPTQLMIAKGPTARRKDPACGTCRKKCRKCDRTHPSCKRCIDKGLHCEGYPPRYQFLDSVPPGRPSETTVAIVNALPSTIISLPVLAPELEREFPSESPTSSTPPSISRGQPPLSSSNFSLPPLPQPIGVDTPLAPSPSSSNDDIYTHEYLLCHFREKTGISLSIAVDGTLNPFHEYLIPLSSQNEGVFHALLGLTACHMRCSDAGDGQTLLALALQHRAAALQSLSSLLLKEGATGLARDEEEFVLAIVLLLVLHDICESGISSHGAHLTGVSFLCGRLACPSDVARRSKVSMFFMTALAWLDMLRGFSGAEKLAYSDEVRECILEHGSLSLHTLVGCPPSIFYRIGRILESAKDYLAGGLPLERFNVILSEAEKVFRRWDPDQAVYPTQHPEWKQLAEAYRQACILRVLRFPDAFVISCEDDRIKTPVSIILDICAQMPRDSVFYKRLLFPLFMAGADASSAHQMHYVSLCIEDIKRSTGYRHQVVTDLLESVWEERRVNSRGWVNVPWMEFTCSALLQKQRKLLGPTLKFCFGGPCHKT